MVFSTLWLESHDIINHRLNLVTVLIIVDQYFDIYFQRRFHNDLVEVASSVSY